MTETITRKCGHTAEFTPHGDKFDDARRLKLKTKQCLPCGLEKNRLDNLKQPKKAKKGQEVKNLPDGTFICLRRDGDVWHGTATVKGISGTIEAQGPGVMGLISKLAKQLLKSTLATAGETG